jgi:multiple sugar transport system ATP-binding protein
VQVLHGVSLDVADGEFVALVGPSGCGKSTLLRMIAGLESVTGGEIRLDGKVMNEVAPKDRDVAMVFQSYALYPHMTVRDNMGFSLKMAGMGKAQSRAAIARAADILGLAPYLDRKPKELSGGQMQRVAMGRAIVRDPAIFLFDEPLSNLDAKLRGKVRGEIQALHTRLGTTTVYVTHDQVEAMTLANRIVVMRDGHVEQIGSPLDLYDRPATEFVAGFIGTPPMNLLAGMVADGVLTLADGTAVPVPVAMTGPLTIGIRPEHLTRADQGWPVTVRGVEVMGHESHVTGSLGQTEVIFTITARDFPQPGQQVHLRPDPGLIHLFRDGVRVSPG